MIVVFVGLGPDVGFALVGISIRVSLDVDTVTNTIKGYFYHWGYLEREQCCRKHTILLDIIDDGKCFGDMVSLSPMCLHFVVQCLHRINLEGH